MNITKIINLVGHLQTILAVLEQLPAHLHREVVGLLKSNGLDPALLSKQAVRAKHTLQAMPADTFDPMLRISALHLELTTRRMILEGTLPSGCGIESQATPWGFLLNFDVETLLQSTDAHDLVDLKAWAADAGTNWVLMHVNYPTVAGLPVYQPAREDSATPAAVN